MFFYACVDSSLFFPVICYNLAWFGIYLIRDRFVWQRIYNEAMVLSTSNVWLLWFDLLVFIHLHPEVFWTAAIVNHPGQPHPFPLRKWCLLKLKYITSAEHTETATGWGCFLFLLIVVCHSAYSTCFLSLIGCMPKQWHPGGPEAVSSVSVDTAPGN